MYYVIYHFIASLDRLRVSEGSVSAWASKRYHNV